MQKIYFSVACFVSMFFFSAIVSFVFLHQCKGSTPCMREATKNLVALVCFEFFSAALIFSAFHLLFNKRQKTLHIRDCMDASVLSDTPPIPHSKPRISLIDDVTSVIDHVTTASLYSSDWTDNDDGLSLTIHARDYMHAEILSDTTSNSYLNQNELSVADDMTTASLHSGYFSDDTDGLSLSST